MGVILANRTVDDEVAELTKRVYGLEMRETGFEHVPTEFPEIIIVPPGGGDGILIDTSVDAPTNVQVSTGAFMDDIFIDVEWDMPANPNVVSAWVELAEKNGAVYTLVDAQNVIGTTYRFSALKPNQAYGVRVEGLNRIGMYTDEAPWIDVTTGQDLTPPPAVTGLILARGATSIIVKFTPLTYAQAADVARAKGLYEVQVDTSLTFDTANLRTNRSSAFVVAFNDITVEGTWYARVAAIDSSGNMGPYATTTGAMTTGGVVDSMIVAGLDAAKITFGTMDGDRITANTADIAIIENNTSLTSKNINIAAGGQLIIGSPPTTGMFINSQGLSFYGGGVRKAFLDTATGNVSIEGNLGASSMTGGAIQGTTITGGMITGTIIQTAFSGRRLVIDYLNAPDYIQFYDSSGTKYAEVGIFNQTFFEIRTANTMQIKGLSGSPSDLRGVNMAFLSVSGTTVLQQSGGIDLTNVQDGDFSGTLTTSTLNFTNVLQQNGATVINASDQFVGAGGVDTNGSVDGFDIKVSGTTVINSLTGATFGTLTVNGTTTIAKTSQSGWNTAGLKLDNSGGSSFLAFLASSGEGSLAMSSAEQFHFKTTNDSSYAVVYRNDLQPSSIRYKKVEGMLDDPDLFAKIDKIDVVRFRPNVFKGAGFDKALRRKSEEHLIGVTAESVAQVFPELVVYDSEGLPESVQYTYLAAVAIRAVQQLRKDMNEIRERLDALEAA